MVSVSEGNTMPLGAARQDGAKAQTSAAAHATRDDDASKGSLRAAIARSERNVNGKRNARDTGPAGVFGNGADDSHSRAMRPPAQPVKTQVDVVKATDAKRVAHVTGDAAVAPAGASSSWEDSVEVTRRRFKTRRPRASGGNQAMAVDHRREHAVDKGLYGDKVAPSRGTARNEPEFPFMSADQKAFACQFLNELRSTYLLQEALARTSHSQPAPMVDVNWSNNVYVNNLPPQTTDDELYRMGRTYGKVKSHKAIINPNTGLCKGYGFIMYETLEEAEVALQQLPLHGLTASWAKESFTAKLRRMADLTTANVYLSNLPLDYTTTQLEELFAPHHIVSMRLLTDAETRKPKGVGFVRLENRDIAQLCIDNLHGRILPGQTTGIQVRFADSDAQKQLKHSVRGMGGSTNGDSDALKSAGLEPPFFNAYPQSPLLPAWSNVGAVNAEQGFVLRSPNGNKENVNPHGGAHTGLGYFHPQGHGNSHGFGMVPSQMMGQNLLQHNVPANGFLPQPQYTTTNAMFGHQHALPFSPLLHSPVLQQAAGNGQRTVKNGSMPFAQPQQPSVGRGQRNLRELLNAMHTPLTEQAVKTNDAANHYKPSTDYARTAPQIQQRMEAVMPFRESSHFNATAFQGAHPLSSTPLRLPTPMPPTDDKALQRTAVVEAPIPEVTARVSPSTSSASSFAPAHMVPSRSQSAAGYRTKRNSVDGQVQGQTAQDKVHHAKRASTNALSSADESYKTGKECTNSAEEDSDSLEVYCGTQAPVNIHCPRGTSHEDASTSLSKTDSGKDVDQHSVTDAATSIYEKASPPDGNKGQRMGSDAKGHASRLAQDRIDEVVPLSPTEPMPLSEPATIVPDKH